MFRESVRLSLVLPAYDPSGRLHDAVYGVREWMLARPGINELFLAGSPGGDADRRCRVEAGRLEEQGLDGAAERPLARAVAATGGEIVVVADPGAALVAEGTDLLCRRVDEGWDAALAAPRIRAPFADEDPGYDATPGRRSVCFAAYRGSVARRIAARHAGQDFARGDEHLYLLSDPELKVCEEPMELPAAAGEPLSFAGILGLFRDAQATGGARLAPGWTPAPRAA